MRGSGPTSLIGPNEIVFWRVGHFTGLYRACLPASPLGRPATSAFGGSGPLVAHVLPGDRFLFRTNGPRDRTRATRRTFLSDLTLLKASGFQAGMSDLGRVWAGEGGQPFGSLLLGSA